MKKADLNLGSIYIARVSGKLCRVRLEREAFRVHKQYGWYATNLETGREVLIKSAAKLRREHSTSPTFGVDMRVEKTRPVVEPEPSSDMDFEFDDGGLL